MDALMENNPFKLDDMGGKRTTIFGNPHMFNSQGLAVMITFFGHLK